MGKLFFLLLGVIIVLVYPSSVILFTYPFIHPRPTILPYGCYVSFVCGIAIIPFSYLPDTLAYATGTANTPSTDPAPFATQLDRNEFTAEELHNEVMTVLRNRQYRSPIPFDDATKTGTNDEHPTDQLLWRLERTVRLSPYNVTYWNDLGVLHMHRLSYDKALDCFTLGIQLSRTRRKGTTTTSSTVPASLVTKLERNLEQIYQYWEQIGTDDPSFASPHSTITSSNNNHWYTSSLLGYNLFVQLTEELQKTEKANTESSVWDKLTISNFVWSIHRQRKTPSVLRTDLNEVPTLNRNDYRKHVDYLRQQRSRDSYVSSYSFTTSSPGINPSLLMHPFVLTNLNSTSSWKKGEHYEKGKKWWRLWSLHYLSKDYGDVRMVWDTDKWDRDDTGSSLVSVEHDSNDDVMINDPSSPSFTSSFTSSIALLRQVGSTLSSFETSHNRYNRPSTDTYQSSFIRGHLSFKTWESLSKEIGYLPPYLGTDNNDVLLQYMYLAFRQLHGGNGDQHITVDTIQRVFSSSYNSMDSMVSKDKRKDRSNAWVSPSLITDTDAVFDDEFSFFLNDFYTWSGWRSLVITHNTNSKNNDIDTNNSLPSVWRSMIMNNIPYNQWFLLVQGKNVEWTVCEKYPSFSSVYSGVAQNISSTDGLKNSSTPSGLWSIDDMDLDHMNATMGSLSFFNYTNGTVTAYIVYHEQLIQHRSSSSRSCYKTSLYPGDILYIPNNYEYTIQSSTPSIYVNGLSNIMSSLFSSSASSAPDTPTPKENFTLFLDTLIKVCKQQLRDTPNLPFTETQQYVGNIDNSLSSNMAFTGRPNENICQILEKSKEIHTELYDTIMV